MTSSSSPAPLAACSWSWLTPLSVAAAALISLAGCAATPAGSRGVDAFSRESTSVVLNGSRGAADAAACFTEQASFLPLSEFVHDPAGTGFTYRLRVADLWFEQLRITPEGAGSRAELRVAANLDARWTARLERDRLVPLRRCLGS